MRLFLQTESRWSEHLGEKQAFDFGVGYLNPRLGDVLEANCMRDVALPPGVEPVAVHQCVEQHFQSRQARCIAWTMNIAADPSCTIPMADYLLEQGYHPSTAEVMLLEQVPNLPQVETGLTIIPARAAYRQTRVLFEQCAKQWNSPNIAEAAMLHLDDPHYDALLALRGREPVAHAGVLTVGELGRIDDVYVAEAHRRQGIGKLMIARVIEICARAMLRQVMLAVLPANTAAIGLYQQFGFRKIGQFTSFCRRRSN